LGQIARAANARRLGGEEVRFMDIPASDPNSPGIFDGKIKPAPGKTGPRNDQGACGDPEGQCD